MRDEANQRLVNSTLVEALPAALARARDNRSARQLAAAVWLLRRKRDGRFLGSIHRCADGSYELRPLHGNLSTGDAGIDALLDALGLQRPRRAAHLRTAVALRARDTRAARVAGAVLPVHGLLQRLAELGVDADAYQARHQLGLVPEPAELALAGRDRYQRPLFLVGPAARAWTALRTAAAREGVALDAISGYRSHDYQLGIFRRKLARGQEVAEILRVNTAPGYSEHHSGRALDIGTPGEPPAEASFEATPAFAWLQRRAGVFGFVMSYPRGNPHGIVHEPWHWCWRGDARLS